MSAIPPPPLSIPQLQKGKKYLGEKTMFFREGRPPDALGVDFFPQGLVEFHCCHFVAFMLNIIKFHHRSEE